ncbi:capping complex subunit for YIEGIA [Halalkalibacter oceani]|uniref:capping complex subunit for YIEGIA n=1 Tax=Halalkalibacter oceani TaxID=1653776 RepID=UPI003D81BA68
MLAMVTTDKKRYLGGVPLAKDQEELIEVFLADILELKSGDLIIIKNNISTTANDHIRNRRCPKVNAL